MRLRLAPLLPLVLVCACAGPQQLAKISERQLKAGDARAAYETARKGVDKDPSSEAARRAMSAAAARLLLDGQGRVLNAVQADTLAAAGAALDLVTLRAELARYRIAPAADSGYALREDAIRNGAARIEYRRAEDALAEHRPKSAYAHFTAAARYVAGWRDVQERIRKTHALAMTRVAILPFANDTGVPHLSEEMADAVFHEVAETLAGDPTCEFTELVDRDEINASLTLKDLESLGPDEALRVAHGVEADRVVVGRLHGMRASRDAASFDRPIYRRTTQRDSSGKNVVRYVATRLAATARERTVTVRYTFDVLDVHTRQSLATRSEAFTATAKVVWTDFRAEGNCDDYLLAPPDLADKDEARGARQAWHDCFGDWKLPELLREAREERRRGVYQRGDRDEFLGATRGHPHLREELPGENDLAYVALHDLWRPVFAALRELDRKD